MTVRSQSSLLWHANTALSEIAQVQPRRATSSHPTTHPPIRSFSSEPFYPFSAYNFFMSGVQSQGRALRPRKGKAAEALPARKPAPVPRRRGKKVAVDVSERSGLT